MYLTIQCFSHLTNVRTLQSKKMTQVGLLTEDQHKECAMERLSIKPVVLQYSTLEILLNFKLPLFFSDGTTKHGKGWKKVFLQFFFPFPHIPNITSCFYFNYLIFLLIGFLAYFITIGLQSVQSLALIPFCKQCELPFFIDSCRRFHGNAGTIVNRGKVYLARSVHLARQLTGKKAF